jgi:hypothetical protein
MILPWISLLVMLNDSTRDADADQKHGEQDYQRDHP